MKGLDVFPNHLTADAPFNKYGLNTDWEPSPETSSYVGAPGGAEARHVSKRPQGDGGRGREKEVPGSSAAPSMVTIQNTLIRSPRVTDGVSEYTEALNTGPGRKGCRLVSIVHALV